jgi:hypothetical protein
MNISKMVTSLAHDTRTNIHGAIGPREFVYLVDQIPSQFLYPPDEGTGGDVFTSRLHFIVTYAEFHHAVSQDIKTPKILSDVVALMNPDGHQAPQSWWGLLLADIGELLAGECCSTRIFQIVS